METFIAAPHYLFIARDIAARIANGDLIEGERIYGRSVMASQYNVSPETIRRALRLLADMKVVEVKPQSGAEVLSADNARRYIANFEENSRLRSLHEQLSQALVQYRKMGDSIIKTTEALLQSRSTFSAADCALPNYDVPIPADSPLNGKNIGELKFWQATGSTVVAIRRGQTVILSPGPYAELYGGDVIVLVGTQEAADAAAKLVSKKE